MRINTFQWTTTATAGTQLGFVSFPYDILSKESMGCRMSRFRYFRADIEVQVRLNSTNFHYGQLLCHSLPDTTDIEYDSLVTDIYTASQLNSYLLLANSATSVTFDIPYQHQGDFVDISDVVNDPDSLARVAFWILSPLSTSADSASSTVDVTVWARFKNFHINGPSAKGYTMPTMTFFDKKKNKKVKPKIQMQSEEVGKSINGVISGIGERVKAFASSFKKIPIVGGLAKPVLDIAEDLGLDKPNSLQSVQPVARNSSKGLINGKGLQDAIPLGLDPKAHLSDDQRIFGAYEPECISFKALARRPSLRDWVNIPVTTVAGTTIKTYDIAPVGNNTGTVIYDNWLACTCRFFELWRGDMDFMFVFSTSGFTSARFRISWVPSADSDPETDNGGDIISNIVDVKGDTIYRVSIPFMSKKSYLQSPTPGTPQTGDPAGYLKLSLINSIVSFDSNLATTSIHCSVWVAAGNSFDLAIPRRTLVPSATNDKFKYRNEKVEPQGDIRQAFKQTFPPIIKADSIGLSKYSTSESCLSIKTFLHRAIHIGDETGTGTPNNTYLGPFPNVSSGFGCPLLLTLFRFVRGSSRYTVHFWNGNPPLIKYNLVTTHNNFTDGLVPMELIRGELCWTFSIPYYSNYRYWRTANTLTDRNQLYAQLFITTDQGDPSNTISSYYWSAGDDFSVGGLGTTPTKTIASLKKKYSPTSSEN